METGRRKTLSVLVTLGCTSGRCRHCYIDSQQTGSADLDPDTWKDVLTRFRDRGGEEVYFHGGEPLEYRGIQSLLKHADLLGLRTTISTNGIHVDDQLAGLLADCQTYVLLSLDGPESYYSFLRGANRLPEVITKAEKLLDAGVQVHPVHVVSKLNQADLSWIESFCTDRGIAKATLSPLMALGRAARELTNLLLTPSELDVFFDTVQSMNAKSDPRVHFVTSEVRYRPEDAARFVASQASLEGFVDESLYALNDGALTVDVDLPNPRRWIFGSIFDLENVDGRVYQDYRRLLGQAFERGIEKLRGGDPVFWPSIFVAEARRAGLGEA